jgi:hypothetical protein
MVASYGIVELRAHGFGGRFESELQRAWRLGTKATRSRLVGHRRRLAHRKCTAARAGAVSGSLPRRAAL